MPTGGTTGEFPAPHLSSSPATTCTPRAHSPLPLSRPERLSPARGTLICGMRARQDPWKGPRSSNKCACQHLGRPAIRAALELVPVEVEGGWRRYNGCGGTVPQYTKDTAQRAAIHHTGTATEEKSLPPAAGLGWKGGEPAANGDPTAHLDSNRAGWMRSSFRAEFAQGWAFCSSSYCLNEKSLVLLQNEYALLWSMSFYLSTSRVSVCARGGYR